MVEDKDTPPPVEDEPETIPRQTRSSQHITNHTSNGPSTNGTDSSNPLPSSSNGNGQLASWECSVCTYKNIEEEFKCAMCETRKGTSTRKPRATSQTQVVQIQALAAELVAKQTNALLRKQRRRHIRLQNRVTGQNTASYTRPGRLKNVDRSRGTKINVTVNNVTVVITDYPEMKEEEKHHAPSISSSTPSPRSPSIADID